MPLRLLTVLLILVVLTVHSYGASSSNLPANTTTNMPAKAEVRPEDLLWNSARECLKKAQYKDAHEKFVEFARQYRSDALFTEALYYQGLCQLRLGQDVQALSLWDQVLKQEMQKKPKSRAWQLAMEQLTIWYGRKSREEDQEKALKQLLAEFPTNPLTVRLHIQAAAEKLKGSDYAAALAFYRAVEGQLTDPDKKNLELAATITTKGAKNPRDLLEAAKENLEKNEVELAISLYQAFLKKNTSSPLAAEAKTKLGWCFYLKRDYDKAEKLCKEVIKAGPSTSHWVGKSRWYLIVLAAGPQGKVSKAIELCDAQAKAFDGDRLAEQALFIKAWLYWTQKEWAKGKTAFDELLAKYPARGAHPPVKKYISDCENGMSAKTESGK